MEDTITISKQEYNQLVKDSEILEALYSGGVDNWEWYEESLSSIEDN